MKWQLTLLALLAAQLCAFASKNDADSTRVMPYYQGFQFESGIYLTIDNWKENNPIPREAIISNYDARAPYFYLQVFNKKWIKYRDANGNVQKVESERVFGYSVDNVVYTNHHLKIAIIGSICHYTSVLYQVDDPNFSGLASTILDLSLTNQSGFHKQEKYRQFILNFETGRSYRFTERYFKKLIATDVQLYQEYKQFKGRKKDRRFIFLKKYNDRHPIYFAQAD